MPYTEEEWNRLAALWGAPTPRLAPPTTDAPSAGRMVAQITEPEPQRSRLSQAADVFRSAVPQQARDVGGRTLRAATQGSRFLDELLPGSPGTAIKKKVEEVPVIGGLLATGLDIATAPSTILTAGWGAGIQAPLRAVGPLGKLAALLVSPASRSASPVVRLFSETVMGTTGTFAAEKAAEATDNQLVGAIAGIGGALVGGYGLNVAEGAARTFRRGPSAAIGVPASGRKFLEDLLPADVVAKEIKPAAAGSFEASSLGKAANNIIDPSRDVEGQIGVAMHVGARQAERGGMLTEVSLQGAVDSHARGAAPVAAPGGSVFDVDNVTGKIKNVPGNPDLVDFVEQRRSVQAAGLRDDQRAFLTDVHQWLDELNVFRKDNGLKTFKNPDAELAHVTRIVRGIREIEDVGRTNSFLERVYETRAQGIEAGVKYENDLRGIMSLMGNATYREAAAAQMESLLKPLLVSPKEVLLKTNAQVAQARGAAAKQLRDARLAVRQERRAAIKEGGTRLRSEVGPAISDTTRDALDAAKQAAGAARRAYTSELTGVKASRVLPGYIFGRSERDVAVGTWKGKFLPADADYLKLAEKVDTLTGQTTTVKMDPFTTRFQQASDAIRLASATGDAAAPFVHGLPLLGQNPLLWAKAAKAQYRSMADPASIGRYVKQNLATVQEMARYGVPIGDIEQYIAMSEGRGLSAPIHKFAGTGAGRQSLGRLEAGMDGFLTTARTELWKSLRPLWDGTTDELATYVRDATGALSTKALGVGAHQRAYENVWLAFSPRLMRSTLALVVHAANPDTAVGRQAARSLLGLAAVGSLMAVATNLAVAAARGENEEQAWQRVGDTLNPTTGKFLSVDIGGQRIGVGGQVRAITQFVAKSLANPAGFASAAANENPLINFYMGRGSVGVNIAGALVEGATDEKVNVLPYESIDTLPDVLRHLGTSLAPFAMQAQIDARDLSKIDRVTAGLTSFGGLSANEKSPTERINDEAKARWEKPFSELTGVEQQTLEKDRADLFALRDQQRDELGGKEARIRAAKLRLTEDTRLSSERALVDAYQRGVISAKQFRDEMKATQRDSAVLKREIRGPYEELSADENKQALSAWYATFDQAKIPGTEIVDWDAQEAIESTLLAKLTPSQKRYIDERRKTPHAEEAKWYFDNEDLVKKAGYYGASDRAFEQFRERMPAGLDSYGALILAKAQAVNRGDVYAARLLTTLKNRVDAIADREKRRLRLDNPELDRALQQNGRVSTLMASNR